MILAEPLARALETECPWHRQDGQPPTCSSALLAALRADPATVAAIAEALHEGGWGVPFEGCKDGQPERKCKWHGLHAELARNLADALFGAP